MVKLIFLLIILPSLCLSQSKKATDFGFRHFQTTFKTDTVDILIKSKEKEEEVRKPIFLFCEGSLPQPLIKTDGDKIYGMLHFKIPEKLLKKFHLVMISKPYIPLVADKSELSSNFMYFEKTGKVPDKYRERNYLDYYVKRNIEAINFLQTNIWVDDSRLVVAGHSQGSTVAAQMAYEFDKVTHLIYSGGNPFGRMMNIIAESRKFETDSLPTADRTFGWWEDVVTNSNRLDIPDGGDTHKNTFDFSQNLMEELLSLKMPVLVTYGTLDYGSIFNDYLRLETIRKEKRNFTYKALIGTEHNYFPLSPDGTKNFKTFNWNKVAMLWSEWIEKSNYSEY